MTDHLSLLADLIAQARKAGADAADARAGGRHFALRAAPPRQDRAGGARRGPGPRPAGVRSASRRRSSPTPDRPRPASRRWPSAPSPWPGWCRRTRMPASPTPPPRLALDDLDLEDSTEPHGRSPDRARRRGGGGGTGGHRRDQLRRRGMPATAAPPSSLVTSATASRAAGRHQPLGLRHRPGRAAARGWSGTTTTTAPSTWRTSTTPPCIGRRAGEPRGGAAQPGAAEDRAAAGGLRPPRRRRPARPPRRRDQRRRRSRAAPPSCATSSANACSPPGVTVHRRPDAGVRGLRSRPFDGEGMHAAPPRARRGRRAHHLAPGLAVPPGSSA